MLDQLLRVHLKSTYINTYESVLTLPGICRICLWSEGEEWI